jgi:hypothetical protein
MNRLSDLLSPLIAFLETGVHTWATAVTLFALGGLMIAAKEWESGSAAVIAGVWMVLDFFRPTAVIVMPSAPPAPPADEPTPPKGYGLR